MSTAAGPDVSTAADNLTRDTLPTPDSRRPLVPVVLPNWGGKTLYVRRLSAGETQDLPDDRTRFTQELVLRCVAFADGELVWQAADLDTVMAYPLDDLKPLIEAALEVNGLSRKSVETRKEK